MDDDSKTSARSGDGRDVWVLIPLAALSIPIIAVLGESESPLLPAAFAAIVVLAAVTLAIRSLMTHRHNLRMVELEARERIATTERERLAAAERVLELDDGIADLKSAVERSTESGSP